MVVTCVVRLQVPSAFSISKAGPVTFFRSRASDSHWYSSMLVCLYEERSMPDWRLAIAMAGEI